ncbi:MAG: hypothetical protein IJW17_11120 [Lentisphaeria bacterium]|nr:hypothetical protein [Lentisphaeria bacterium]
MFDSILKSCTLFLPYPALALAISLGLTYVAITILPLLGYIDIPRGRHQHEKPVPRGGGVAIWIAFFVTVFLQSVMFRDSNPELYKTTVHFLHNFLLPAGIIFVVGLIDDRYELRSIIKLFAQIAVGVLIFRNGGGITNILGYGLSSAAALGITVFWCVMIINAFNLIDGVDGIAAGLGAISSLLLAIWTLLADGSAAMVLILLIFSASCLGFLRFNFSPARIFMGDTGSMFLGLFFAYISMQYSTKSVTMTSLLIPLAAIGVPMFDVFLAVWRRFFRKYIYKVSEGKVMDGDHDHLHHRILKETGTARKTAFVIYSLSLGISLLAMACTFLESSLPTLIFVLFLIIFFVMIRYSSIELYDTLTYAIKGLQKPHRNFVFTALLPVVDCCLCFVAFLLCRQFFNVLLPVPDYPWWLVTHAAPFIVVLCCSGIYRTFWLRAGIIQYYKLVRLLCIAGMIGYILNCFVCVYFLDLAPEILWQYSGFYISYTLLIVVSIAGERFLLRYYESFGYRRLSIRNQGKTSTLKRVIIYGGGLACRMYVCQLYCSSQSENLHIVGIIDDNPALNGLNVYGFNVLGTLRRLDAIYRKKEFDAIVITCKNLSAGKLRRLQEFQKKHHIQLSVFSCEQKDLSE